MNMKKILLVMLLGLSSTVALRASERHAPVLSGQEQRFRDRVTQFFTHPNANMDELMAFGDAVKVALPFKESDREQRFDEGVSAPMSRELSVVKERKLTQPGSEKELAKMTPAQLKVAARVKAFVQGAVVRRQMGDSIQINANMKQMDLLHEMVGSYAQEGNHAMIDFCLKLLSGLKLDEIGLRHGDMGKGLQRDREAAESPWSELRLTTKNKE